MTNKSQVKKEELDTNIENEKPVVKRAGGGNLNLNININIG